MTELLPLNLLREHLVGNYHVDRWGLDEELSDWLCGLARFRWSIEVENAHLFPTTGSAVLVFNRSYGISEPAVLAVALRQHTGRSLRVPNASSLPGLGRVGHRLGSIVNRIPEISSILRTNAVVGIPLNRSWREPERAGTGDMPRMLPAIDQHVPVFPVAIMGDELGRKWRVEIGESINTASEAPSLAAAELADRSRQAIQEMLNRRNKVNPWY